MTLTALGMPALRSRTNGIADPRVVPTTGPLVDTFGRVANDLRVSLTDRCNLRCSYCMPERGLRWLPGEQLLRPDELARLIHIAVTRLGSRHRWSKPRRRTSRRTGRLWTGSPGSSVRSRRAPFNNYTRPPT